VAQKSDTTVFIAHISKKLEINLHDFC